MDKIKVALLIVIRGGVIVLGGRTEIGERREIEGVGSFSLNARFAPFGAFAMGRAQGCWVGARRYRLIPTGQELCP